MTAHALPLMSEDDLNRASALRGEDEGFGSLSTSKGNLPLVALDVRAQLTGLLAQVTLTQTFENPFDERLEATYIFPLPDRGALTRLRMQVDGRIIEGILQERGQARETYDRAIEAGHRAAIAEEERPGVFTLRMGNLDAKERATVTLHLTVPLSVDDGEATFRFPLVVAPRYIPGRAIHGEGVGVGVASDTDAVPDASRISPPILLPGFPNPIRLSIEVEVDPAGLEVGPMRSSLHAITTSALPDGRTQLAIQPGERVNRDFILRFPVAPSGIATGLVRAADAKGETLALTLVPPAELSRAERPREVVFLLDRSGSMSGWKMVAARRALGRMVDSLTARDTFSVLAFDHDVEPLSPLPEKQLCPASDRNRFRVVESLGKIEARGGTELLAPLEGALQLLDRNATGSDRIVVLVTDGQVGNEDQILARIANRLQGLRIFTVGIDTAVNEGFLRRLAAIGGGSCELIESEDRLDDAMDRIHRRIATPVLEGLEIEVEGATLETGTMVPGRLPALFVGTPLTVMGRLVGATPGAEVRAHVRATDALGQPWSTTLTACAVESAAPGVTWARGALRTLEDRYVVGGSGDREALAARIVELSLDHGVLCRFTAFVAVDRQAKVGTGMPLHQVTQAVELPDGWMPMSAGAPRSSSGELSRSAPRGLRMPGALQVSATGAPPPPPAPKAAKKKAELGLHEQVEVAILACDDALGGRDEAFGGGAPAQAPEEVEAAPFVTFTADASEGPVLAAYVQRSRDISEALENSRDLAGLRAAAMALKTLAEDLESTLPGSRAAASIKALLTSLREALTKEPVDVAAQVDQVLVGLRDFAEQSAHTSPTPVARVPGRGLIGRLPFWR